MGEPEPGEVTRLLKQWQVGDRQAEAKLFELVLPELRRLAHYYMQGQPEGHTIAPTALVNEIYLKLTGSNISQLQDRRHFFAVAGRAMRQVLVDYARARPRGQFLPLDEDHHDLAPPGSQLDLAIAIDEVLEELEKTHPDLNLIVELKFFLGLKEQEIAPILNLPLRTTQRKWQEARAWLYRRLRPSYG
jgi:RNA polymerase sigma factor (TIGR02999 family)